MFRDRADAGQQLARKLAGFTDRADVVVVGLLRGGVPVAFEIAQVLHVPLDVLLVRKLGVPSQPELAMGAIASGGIKIIDRQMIHAMGLSREQVDTVVELQTAELHRREQFYSDVRQVINMKDHIVIVVDDGIATGASMLAAVAVLRLQHPKEIIIATPVAPSHAQCEMGMVADQFICLHLTDNFSAVGAFYRNFSQTEDREVRSLLIQAAKCCAKTHH